jgi:hypothetical protein
MIGRPAAIALLALAMAPWGSAAAARRACAKPHGYVVEVKTRYAVVYTQRRGEGAYGCLFSRGQLVPLYDSVGAWTLAGRYVAFAQVSYYPDGTVYYLFTVVDLRRSAWHLIWPMYELVDGGSGDGEDWAFVTDVVLRKNGSAAWISCRPLTASNHDCRGADEPTEVWRSDTRGRKRLDASTDVGLRSLKRKGSTITWRHGSKARTAQLR